MKANSTFTCCPLAFMKPRMGAAVQVNYVMKAKSDGKNHLKDNTCPEKPLC